MFRLLKKNGNSVTFALWLGVSLTTLLFGLWPHDLVLFNQLVCSSNPAGLNFGKYGIAYSEPFDFYSFSSNGSFTLEVAFRPSPAHQSNFKNILTIYGHDDLTQLIIGQWKSWIIVMQGSDYDYSLKRPRISFKIGHDNQHDDIVFLTLLISQKETKLFLDGQLKYAKKPFLFRLPHEKVRLIIGNDAYSLHPWNGSIYGVALYPDALTIHEIHHDWICWSSCQCFDFPRETQPLLCYDFKEICKTRKIINNGNPSEGLIIPKTIVVLKKQFLKWPQDLGVVNEKGFFTDITINIVGFVPVGAITMLFFFNILDNNLKKSFLFSLFYCCSMSLFIEFSQMWLPSRYSDMLDFVCNVLGALVGIFLAFKFFRLFRFLSSNMV